MVKKGCENSTKDVIEMHIYWLPPNTEQSSSYWYRDEHLHSPRWQYPFQQSRSSEQVNAKELGIGIIHMIKT